MKLVVTGAGGYIGSILLREAKEAGHQVISATRRPVPAAAGWLPFDLSHKQSIALPAHCAAVIHLAADTASRLEEAVEVAAANRLLAAAQAISARFIFVSSQTARADAPTAYGRTKWRIEQVVLAAGGWVVRPGQVYGGPQRGLFGVLMRGVQASPVLPAFLPAPRLQPIHVADLARGLLAVASGRISPGVLHLAAPTPITFTRFLQAMARARVRRKRLWLPVPVVLCKVGIVLLGRRLATRAGLDRLNSLFALPATDCANDLSMLALRLRPLEAGMHKSGTCRRSLLQEGRALLRYVLRDHPAPSLLKRYLRAIETLRGGAPLPMPAWVHRWPVTLSVLDGPRIAADPAWAEFVWRLNAATILAEATPVGAQRFLDAHNRSRRVAIVASIGWALLATAGWWLLQRCLPRTAWRSEEEAR